MVATSGVSKLKRQGHLESAGGLGGLGRAGDVGGDEENLGGTMVWGKGTDSVKSAVQTGWRAVC